MEGVNEIPHVCQLQESSVGLRWVRSAGVRLGAASKKRWYIYIYIYIYICVFGDFEALALESQRLPLRRATLLI